MTPVDDATRSRFLKKIATEPTARGCLLWLAAKSDWGYGRFLFLGRNQYAHRVAWFIAYGEFPDLLVLHRCDTPACVNPKHLFLGTDQDNSDDKIQKGRLDLRKGSHNANDRLAAADVEQIRSLFPHDASPAIRSAAAQALGKEFDVTSGCIRSIVTGRTWRHLLHQVGGTSSR